MKVGRRRSRRRTGIVRSLIFTTPTQSDADVLNMASFRKTRDLLAIAFDACYINEEEFVLLWDAYKSKNLDFCSGELPTIQLEG